MFSLLTTENLLCLQNLFPAIIVLTVLAYLTRSGLFRKIEISTREPVRGSLTVCYKTCRGSNKGKYS